MIGAAIAEADSARDQRAAADHAVAAQVFPPGPRPGAIGAPAGLVEGRAGPTPVPAPARPAPPTLRFNFTPTEAQEAHIQKLLPGYTLQWTPGHHEHPYSAAQRIVTEREIHTMIQSHLNRIPAGQRIVDVGGNPTRGENLYGTTNYWALNPTLEPKDYAREFRVAGMNLQRCHHTLEESLRPTEGYMRNCQCTRPYIHVSTDVAYYLKRVNGHPIDIEAAVQSSTTGVFIAAMLQFRDTVGTLNHGEARYESFWRAPIGGEGPKERWVRMYVRGNGHPYENPACDWVDQSSHSGNLCWTIVRTIGDMRIVQFHLKRHPLPLAPDLGKPSTLAEALTNPRHVGQVVFRPHAAKLNPDNGSIAAAFEDITYDRVQVLSVWNHLLLSSLPPPGDGTEKPGWQQQTISIPKRLIGEVALQIVGKNRDRDTWAIAVETAKKFAKQVDGDPANLARAVPHIAALAYIHTLDDELSAHKRLDDSRYRLEAQRRLFASIPGALPARSLWNTVSRERAALAYSVGALIAILLLSFLLCYLPGLLGAPFRAFWHVRAIDSARMPFGATVEVPLPDWLYEATLNCRDWIKAPTFPDWHLPDIPWPHLSWPNIGWPSPPSWLLRLFNGRVERVEVPGVERDAQPFFDAAAQEVREIIREDCGWFSYLFIQAVFVSPVAEELLKHIPLGFGAILTFLIVSIETFSKIVFGGYRWIALSNAVMHISAHYLPLKYGILLHFVNNLTLMVALQWSGYCSHPRLIDSGEDHFKPFRPVGALTMDTLIAFAILAVLLLLVAILTRCLASLGRPAPPKHTPVAGSGSFAVAPGASPRVPVPSANTGSYFNILEDYERSTSRGTDPALAPRVQSGRQAYKTLLNSLLAARRIVPLFTHRRVGGPDHAPRWSATVSFPWQHRQICIESETMPTIAACEEAVSAACLQIMRPDPHPYEARMLGSELLGPVIEELIKLTPLGLPMVAIETAVKWNKHGAAPALTTLGVHAICAALPLPLAILTHSLWNAGARRGVYGEVAYDVCCDGTPFLPLHTSKTPFPSDRDASISILSPEEHCTPKIATRLLGPGLKDCKPVVGRGCQHNEYLSLRNRVLFDHDSGEFTEWSAHRDTVTWLIRHRHYVPRRVDTPTLEAYLSRFPPSSRNRLLERAAKYGRGRGRNASRTKAFLKKEHLLKADRYGVAQFVPRFIQGKEDDYLIDTGPIGWAIGNDLKQQWNHKGMIYYTSGASAEALGKWYDTALKECGSTMLENDARLWDASTRFRALELEMILHTYCTDDADYLAAIRKQSKAHGNTPHGCMFTGPGHRESGVINTSFGNSWLNALYHVRLAKECAQRLGLPFNKYTFRCAILGDDNLMAGDSRLLAMMRAEGPAYFARFGYDVKMVLRPDARLAEYCSGRFYPTSEGSVWAPKIGRCLAKMCWRLQGANNASDLAWLAGVAKGYRHDVSHVPILRAVVDNLQRHTEGVKPAVLPREQRARAIHSHTVVPDTWDFMWHTYGLSRSEVLDVETAIYNAPEGASFVDNWLTGRLTEVDVGEIVGLPERIPLPEKQKHIYCCDFYYECVAPITPIRLARTFARGLDRASVIFPTVLNNLHTTFRNRMSNAANKKKSSANPAAAPARKSSAKPNPGAGATQRGRTGARQGVPAGPRRQVQSAQARSGAGRSKASRDRARSASQDPLFERQVEALMFSTMCPDITEAPRLGMNPGAATAPFRLNYKFSAPWSVETEALSGELPQNELFVCQMTKHPNLGLIYDGYDASASAYKDLVYDDNFDVLIHSGEPLELTHCVRSAPSPTGCTIEPVFDSPNDEEGALVWADATNAGAPTLTFTYRGALATFFAVGTNYKVYYCRRIANSIDLGVLTFAGDNSKIWAVALPGAGYYSFVPAFDDSANVVDESGFGIKITKAAGMCVYHDPLPAAVSTAVDSIRVNAARPIITNFTSPLNAEGGATGYELPDGETWCGYAYSGDTAVSSIFTNVMEANDAQVKTYADGVSSFYHPAIEEELVDTTQDGIVAASQADAFGSDAAPMRVPWSALSGGVMLVAKTALSEPGARDGIIQTFWHVECETESQLFATGPPQHSPAVIEETYYRLRFIRVVTGNPNHVVAAIRSVAGFLRKNLPKVGTALTLGGAVLTAVQPELAPVGMGMMQGGAMANMAGSLF